MSCVRATWQTPSQCVSFILSRDAPHRVTWRGWVGHVAPAWLLPACGLWGTDLNLKTFSFPLYCVDFVRCFFAPSYSSVNCLAAIFWLRCCVSLFQTLPRFVDLVWKERCWSTDKFRRWLANVSSVWNNWVFCVVPYQNWSCDFLISTFVALARRYLLEWTTWCF